MKKRDAKSVIFRDLITKQSLKKLKNITNAINAKSFINI